MTRDRLALAGLYLWIIAGIGVLILLFGFKNMTLTVALTIGLFPFAAGCIFITPRVLFVRRMFAHGVRVQAQVLEKQDYERRGQTGSVIRYAYEHGGTPYRGLVNTGRPVATIRPGEATAALVDPANPRWSLLPRIFE